METGLSTDECASGLHRPTIGWVRGYRESTEGIVWEYSGSNKLGQNEKKGAKIFTMSSLYIKLFLFNILNKHTK